MLKFETIEPPTLANASVIILHGLGANGYDLMSLVPTMHLPEDHTIRFIFPHAPSRAVTINGGAHMPAWYDITGFSKENREDLAGLEHSRLLVDALIQNEIAKGILPERIFLGGFSQGGGLTLFTGLQLPYPLAGLIVLSAYLPCAAHVFQHLGLYAKRVPIFMAHGTQDLVVHFAWGEMAKNNLLRYGFSVDWQTYPIAHEICPAEIHALAGFLRLSLSQVTKPENP